MRPQLIPRSLRGVSFKNKCVLVRHTCIYKYLLYLLETGIAQAGYSCFTWQYSVLCFLLNGTWRGLSGVCLCIACQ